MFMIMAEEFGCWRLDQNPASDSRALQEIGPFIFACPFKLESVIIIVCQGGRQSSPGPAMPGSSDYVQASCSSSPYSDSDGVNNFVIFYLFYSIFCDNGVYLRLHNFSASPMTIFHAEVKSVSFS